MKKVLTNSTGGPQRKTELIREPTAAPDDHVALTASVAMQSQEGYVHEVVPPLASATLSDEGRRGYPAKKRYPSNILLFV